jgi:biotin carboxyl carrier protein
MKTEIAVHAGRAGRVRELLAPSGSAVVASQPILIVDDE